MAQPRVFLHAPAGIADATLLACAAAACEAADCASITVAEGVKGETVAALQALGLAVLVRATDLRACRYVKADGLHISASDDITGLRGALGGTDILGVDCGTSRHAAMEAAEAGADYVALGQSGYHKGEPVVGWWAALAEVPVVASEPAPQASLDTLLPQKPDFVRPDDAMWASASEASRILTDLARRIAQ
jgi:thiamine-phosphate pyrophosphorylase